MCPAQCPTACTSHCRQSATQQACYFTIDLCWLQVSSLMQMLDRHRTHLNLSASSSACTAKYTHRFAGTASHHSCCRFAALGRVEDHLAVPSWEAVTQREPSAVMATSTTQPLCPASEAVQRPVSTSHTRAVKSSPAVMARRPSGVRATAHTPAVVQAR